MSVERPITKKTAINYLLGFHCAGARISESDVEMSYGFNTTTEQSVGVNVDIDGIWSEDNRGGYNDTNSNSGRTGNAENNYPIIKDNATYNYNTGQDDIANLGYTYDHNEIGEQAVALAKQILSFHNDYYSMGKVGEYEYDSAGRKKFRTDWPPISQAGQNVKKYGFDCSSFCSYIYRVLFDGTSIASKYAGSYDSSYGNNGGFSSANSTGDFSTLFRDNNMLVGINTGFPSTDQIDFMLPGDIILWSSGSINRYNYGISHASLYIGKDASVDNDPAIIETNGSGSPLKLRSLYWRNRKDYTGDLKIMFIARPSIHYYKKVEGINVLGLSFKPGRDDRTENNEAGFPSNFKRAYKIS